MDENKKKELQKLYENRYYSETSWDAFEDFCKAEGIDMAKVSSILAAAPVDPKKPSEKREAKKGVNPSHNRTEGPIELEKIAKAYGVDLGTREKGEKLSDFLKNNGVFAFIPESSREKYLQDQRNAFENLGLNWDNVEDRGKLANSIGYHVQNDVLDANAKEFEESPFGMLLSVAMPRVYEKGLEDIRTGEESSLADYVKAGSIDGAEDVSMLVGNPTTGILRIITKKAAPKVGAKIAGKAARSAKSLAGELANAATVPTLTEIADDIAYNEENNERSDFSGTDAAVGTSVNLIAPYLIGRKGGAVLRKIPGLGEKIGNVVEGVGKTKIGSNIGKPFSAIWELDPGIDNLYINKAGKSSMASSLPIVGGLVQPREEEKKDIKEKKIKTEEKHKLWKKGFSVPMPGDKDFDEYQAWKAENTKRIFGLI